MSTSFIGDVSIIEVCVCICGIYFMLEEFKKKSIQKYHNVAVGEGNNKVHMFCQNRNFLESLWKLSCLPTMLTMRSIHLVRLHRHADFCIKKVLLWNDQIFPDSGSS